MLDGAMACLRCGAAERAPATSRDPLPRQVWRRRVDEIERAAVPASGAADEPAGLLLRLSAHLVDQLLLVPAVVLMFLWAGVGDISWESRHLDTWRLQLEDIAERTWWPLVGLQVAYFAIFEASQMRGTPGKWFLGLAVGDNDGDQLGLVHTALRAAAKVSVLTLFAPIVLLAVFSARHQTVYDKLLGTVVLKRAPQPVYPVPPQEQPVPARPAPPLWDGLIEDWPGPAQD
jgi:uncharacterized RDD family membrane protein YckC